VELSIQARKRLDRAGLKETKIFASGDLDEYGIADLLVKGARIDAFGVGTALATSSDAPALGGVYKLVDVEKDGNIFFRAKFSEEKVTYPGRKQVFRSKGPDGKLAGDVIACEGETFSNHDPLLEQVMRYGKMTTPAPGIDTIRRLTHEQIAAIPEMCFQERECYSVRFSDKLQHLLSALRPKAARSQKSARMKVRKKS
jgi:nicotinate phosphoribosyltransferase